MNKGYDVILKNSIYYRCVMYKSKNFIAQDISTLRICNKNEKNNILNFILKFHIFTLFIWILLCFNNWPSYRLFNYQNNTKNTYLETKRSLAESRETKKADDQGSKIFLRDSSYPRNKEGITEESLQSRMRQNNIRNQMEEEISETDEKIDIDNGNMVQKKDESNNETSFEESSAILVINSRKVFLYSTMILPIISCMFFPLTLMGLNRILSSSIVGPLYNGSIVCIIIGLLLTLLFLLCDELKKTGKIIFK